MTRGGPRRGARAPWAGGAWGSWGGGGGSRDPSGRAWRGLRGGRRRPDHLAVAVRGRGHGAGDPGPGGDGSVLPVRGERGGAAGADRQAGERPADLLASRVVRNGAGHGGGRRGRPLRRRGPEPPAA